MENISPFKSLSQFIRHLVSQFNYIDFTPPINPTVFTKKLISIFSDTNAFWDKLAVPPKWHLWYFIQVKSFRDWNPVRIGFLCKPSEIIITIFEDFDETRFHNEHLKYSIDLRKAWLNHEYFFNELLRIIGAALLYANRTTEEESFANIFKKLKNELPNNFTD